MQQGVDIGLKCIQAVLVYNVLREGFPKSNGTWYKIYVVITYGIRDKVRQCCFLVTSSARHISI